MINSIVVAFIVATSPFWVPFCILVFNRVYDDAFYRAMFPSDCNESDEDEADWWKK